LTGAGGTFCSGADLKMMHGDQSDNPWHARFRDDPDLHWKAFLRHYRTKKPLIAAVEGYAFGGGTEILQGTDIRVAGEGAKFGLTEAKWGLFPLGGSTVRLPRQIPYTKAMELLLTGQAITAQEAKEYGLIGRVVADGEALNEARRLAALVAQNGPFAVQQIKRSVLETLDMSEADGLLRETELGMEVFQSEDAREGPKAFAEKRAPNWKGR
jgi:enoyl-CoA hydratase